MIEALFLITLALPLLAAVLNGVSLLLGDKWLNWRAVQALTVNAALGAFSGSVALAALVLSEPSPTSIVLYRWMEAGNLQVDIGFLLDSLSVLMMVMVTGFAYVIGRFSVNYMHKEQGFTRYFAAFALFIFSMLLLVTGSNYGMLFLGWELVGLCSYLLIGQYNDRHSAARASTEAFVANRVGDAGFLVGLFLLIQTFGSLDYTVVNQGLATADPAQLTTIALCLLLGAVGKSAQLPLGSWLSKAMEGPTPSSALIHAATMVTAGVYLIVRSHALYDAAPYALTVVAILGAATALYGAVVGQTVSDIKGLLASSTTTQLGFMFLACGLGAYAVAVFHMVAHAFIKSYLFLTAPSILHHLHGKIDPAKEAPAARFPTGYLLCTLGATVLLIGPMASIALGITLPGNVWVLAAGALLALGSAVYFAFSWVQDTFLGDHGAADSHAEAAEHHAPVALWLWPLATIGVAGAAAVALEVLPGGSESSWFRAVLGPVVSQATSLDAEGALKAPLGVLLLAMVGFSAVSAVYFGRFRAEGSVPLARYRGLYVLALNRFWIDAASRVITHRWVQGLGRALDGFDTQWLGRLTALPVLAIQQLADATRWIDAHVVTVLEALPRTLANHAFSTADAIDRHAVSAAEGVVRRVLFALARIGEAIERVLVTFESAFVGARSEPARVPASSDRAVARALLVMFSVSMAVGVTLLMVD